MRSQLYSLILCYFAVGCSFLDEPPPYPRASQPDADLDMATVRLPDFGRRTSDAFIFPDRPMPMPVDAAIESDMKDTSSVIELDASILADAGDAGGSRNTQCQERCTEEDQCADGATCDDGRCVPVTCVLDGYCLAQLSDWGPACTPDMRCPDGFGCVAIGPAGLCAPLVGPEAQPCGEDLGPIDRMRADGSLITVCGRPSARCRDNVCGLGCRANEDCRDALHPVCDLESGECRCNETSCETNGTASVCGEGGHCLCTADSDCIGPDVDRCVDGVCGCSSIDVCMADRVNPGTTSVCESPR